ncbi:DUF488 family protein [Leucobacter sp. CSA1]|uniref:DUF488 family protein n=1 Tax=Leucobacter chromiisoli TaxID=2796471 RepID=A0A934UW67_9MICO|nr:DUF488 family protein [Leucobacter chromiisoli]MBK0419612.1 DUF488 family protein [Leucobacter chromiisoli]
MAQGSGVQVRRIYEDPEAGDGTRVLVDRLWPRGVSKERAHLDLWVKEVAPSPELRRWYGHDPEKFDEFRRRYRAELEDDAHAEPLAELRRLSHRGPLTLLTASKRDDISEAAVLQQILTGSAD